MPTLRSGAVILGAYASKIRKTLFAQLKDKVKAGEVSSQEIARSAGELNKALYTLFVERLKLEKGDVVRISIDYEIDEQRINWKWDTIKIECFKRVPEEEIMKNLFDILKREETKYAVRKLRETKLGDLIFEILENEKQIGLIVFTPLDNEAIIRGAIKPTTIIQKRRVNIEGDIEEYLSNSLKKILESGKQAEKEEVEKIINEILSL
jgi:hypothetical protein